jgi:hypothetical protein
LQIDFRQVDPRPPELGGGGSGATRSAPAARAPGEEPVELEWSGPVRITPGGDPMTPAGEAILMLAGKAGGAPVVLTQGGSAARAPAVLYETAGQIATLQGDTQTPVTLTDEAGSVVTTPLLKYDMGRRQARLTGASLIRARVDEADQQQGSVLASFSSRAVLNFADAGSGRGALRIESATMEGDVNIEHPRLRLASQALDLAFDAAGVVPGVVPGGAPGGAGGARGAASGAELKSVSARGGVTALLLDPEAGSGAQPAAIKAETLLLTTSRDVRTRKLYPSRLVAEKDVQSSDGKQSLWADKLVLDLVPKPGTDANPTPQVQTVTAWGNVRAKSEDGSVATAETMTVRDASGSPVITLEGKGTGLSGNEAKVSATRIEYRKAEGTARLSGPGTVVAAGTALGSQGTVPFTVTFSDHALFEEAKDRITVLGDIRVESTDRDGALATATGKTLTISLDPQARANGGAVPAGRDPLIGARRFTGLTLAGDVKIEQVLGDGSGALVRQFTLLSDSVNYLADGGFSVPGAGRLLFVDRRLAPAQQPVRGQDRMPTGRGTTAMKWSDSLSYSPAARRLDFKGQVAFAHQPVEGRAGGDGGAGGAGVKGDEEPLRLFADTLSAFLAPGSAAAAPLAGDTAQLDRITAEGNLIFTGRGLSVRAHTLEFLTAQQILTAAGRDRQPVEIDDPSGAGAGTADSVRLNLKTGQIDQLVRPTGNLGTTRPSGRR